MPLAHDNAWLAEPNLLAPNKKPVQRVTIDRRHHLAPTYAWLFNNQFDVDGNFPDGPFDVIGNANLGVDSGMIAANIIGGTTNKLQWRDLSNYTTGYRFPTTTYTAMSYLTIPTASIRRPTMHGGYFNITGYGPVFWLDAPNPTVYSSDGTTLSSFTATGWTAQGTSPETMVMVVDNGGQPRVYNRGSLLGTGNNSLTDRPYVVSLGHLWQTSTSVNPGFTLGDSMYLYAIWEDRALTAIEIAELEKNIFQYFIPI